MGKQKGGREVDRRTPGSDFQIFSLRHNNKLLL